MNIYVPIIRWKMGEQKALSELGDNVKLHITPLIDVPFTPTAEKNMKGSIDKYWPNRKFYFHLHNSWFEDAFDLDDIYNKFYEQYNKLDKNNAIPVFDLSNINLNIIKKYVDQETHIALKVQNNEFELIEDNLNQYIKEGAIDPVYTDLILDLGYVYTDDYFAKSTVLKSVLLDIKSISEFKSVIISSCSFPNSLVNLDTNKAYNYPRNEWDIHFLSKSLADRLFFDYVYSDHGPSDLEELDFKVGMIPNFKIRYTTFDQYLYIKGISIKKGGLDFDNVSRSAKILINRSDVSKKDFSWGDEKIHSIANKDCTTGGNLTNWISYSYNHHITLIVDRIL